MSKLLILLLIFPGFLWRFSQSCWEVQLLFFCILPLSVFSFPFFVIPLPTTPFLGDVAAPPSPSPSWKDRPFQAASFQGWCRNHEVPDAVSCINFYLLILLRPPQYLPSLPNLPAWHWALVTMRVTFSSRHNDAEPALTADLQLHVPVLDTCLFCTPESSLFAFHFIKKGPHGERTISLVKKK